MSYSKPFPAAIEVEHPNPVEGATGVTRRRPTLGAILDPQLAALGPPAANTRGATPQKPIVDKGKKKVVDKGKGKMVEPQKLEKS